MILIFVLIIILVLTLITALVLIVILVLILVVVVLAVLVLVVVLILILLVIIASATTFVLQHLLGVSIILFRVHIARIAQQGLPVGIHSRLPVFLLDSDITKIIIVVSGIGRHRSDILQSFHGLTGLIVISFTIKRPGKIIVGGE